MNSFGTNFILVNRVHQFLPKPFEQNRWLHVATVVRGMKEYCAFVDAQTNSFYIEEVDPASPNLFVKIKDKQEWADLYHFLKESGVMDPVNFTSSKRYTEQIQRKLND
jgi:hypothetical protein